MEMRENIYANSGIIADNRRNSDGSGHSYEDIETQKTSNKRNSEKAAQQGWTFFETSMYFISTRGKKSWSESRLESGNFTEILRREKIPWIGLTDRDTEGVWKWVDGSALTTKFWGSDEPNSRAGDEDCIVTGHDADPVINWADYPCNQRFVWICEKSIFN
ncbi:C-type lectin domain family 4 member M-like [Colossoma macropomum]|uniref:C-type lectin domain family 4 member M-like n=1 Tax=Colossoma macropomum TaxID=42526 RepID=UPI001864F8E8|nr:C-type lectin domain family 4 member M-like [Colossoma macropomum]